MRNAGYTDGAVQDPRPDLLGAAARRLAASATARPASRARPSAAAASGTATPTGRATRSSTRSTARSATRSPGWATCRCSTWSSALDGPQLCENTVGLLEEKGVANWQSAGAVDKTEWVQQIRTLTTLFPPYQLQEDGHPNYWGQLALRNCFRQAYNGGAPRGGTCTREPGCERRARNTNSKKYAPTPAMESVDRLPRERSWPAPRPPRRADPLSGRCTADVVW